MLDLGSATRIVAGVTLGADADDPRRFHVFPAAPHAAVVGGAPDVRLFRFIKDGSLAGGHLIVGVDLGHPVERLAAVAAELAAPDGPPALEPLDVHAGTFRAMFAGQETTAEGGLSGFVVRALGQTVPELAAPHRARISAELTPEGVALVEAALRSGGAPIGVCYQLQIEGLRPALHVVARVDWGQVYDHLSAAARSGAFLVVDDVQRIIEELEQRRAITVDIVRSLASDDTAASQETALVLAWIQREMVERFCETAFPLDRNPATASLGTAGEIFGIGAQFAVRAFAQVDRVPMTLDFQRAAVVTRTLTLQAHLADLLRGADLAGCIVDAGLDHPFFARIGLRLRSARPLGASYVREVAAQFRYGSSVAPMRLTADAAEAYVETWADGAADRTWHLEPTVTLADDAPVDAGKLIALDPLAGHDRELALDLGRLLGARSIALSVAPDPDRVLVTRAVVQHRRGADVVAEVEVLLTPGAPAGRAWFHDVRAGDALAATPQHLLKDGRQVTGAPLILDTDNVRLPPAFPGALTVQLFASDDWTDLEKVVVAIQKSADGAAGTFVFTAPGQSAAVRLDMPDPVDHSFQVRTSRVFSDGRTEDDDWRTTDVPVVVVGRVAANKLVVDIQPLGPELPAAGVVLIEVEVSYIDAPNQIRDIRTFVIHAAADRLRWEVALADPSRRSYEYRVTVYRTSGAKQVGPWTQTSDMLLVIPVTRG